VRSRGGAALLLWAAIVATACAGGGQDVARTTSSAGASSTAAASGGVDLTKLPVGDQLYGTNAKKGSVYSCITSFNGGGAFRDGPWINAATKTWDATAKLAVAGSVDHHGTVNGKESGGAETITGNGLPTAPTGVFPVAASDAAYAYDRNPNSVKGYTLSVGLPAPVAAASPSCVGGTIGISVLGVPIFSAFDAGGRDAAAHEVQDGCDGHPEMTGQYHYHSLSRCWKDVAGFDPGLFGYALDGFGIYVDRDASGNLLSTTALDECHGRTSEITWHGKKTAMYHYVATPDFPYLVGCYRGTAIKSATGLRIGGP
jgi:hypothetical protein